MGQGVHAKAFYFLLGRYREESLRNSLDGSQEQSNGTSEINADLGSLKFNLGWELDLTTVNKKYDGNRNSMLSVTTTHSRASSPAAPPASVFAPSMRRGDTTVSGNSSSRERASSPAGPRAPQPHPTGRARTELWRAQSHIIDGGKRSASPQSTISSGIGGPRPPPPRRGYTYSHPVNPNGISSVQFPQHLQSNDIVDQYQPLAEVGPPSSEVANRRMSTFCFAQGTPPAEPDPRVAAPSLAPSPMIHAPVPISASKGAMDMDMIVDSDISLFTALKATNLDPDSMSVTPESPKEPATRTSTAHCPESDHPTDLSTRRVSHRIFSRAHGAGQDGKENHAVRDVANAIHSNHRVFSPNQGGQDDKENQSVGEDSGWSYISADDPKSNGVGLGMDRDVGRNMGNVIRLGDGTSGTKSKKDKDKKSRRKCPLLFLLKNPVLNSLAAPTLDFRAINQKRSTSTVLGSPLALSTPAPVGSNRLLTSPVVGEFKGWFSNLFNWKNQANGHGGVLYSSDDVSKTRADVGRLLEGFGISVEGGGFNRGMSPVDCGGTLKCRVEEFNGDLGTAQAFKPVRFRVEFSISPSSGPPATSPNPNSTLLAAPGVNPYLLSGAPPKSRNSMLINKGGYTTPLSSPTPGAEFPPGCVSAVILIYEKGSVSSFKMVWRRLKEVYGDSSTAFPSCSPAMASTPMTEHPTRFAAVA